jgi:hypothetical protein
VSNAHRSSTATTHAQNTKTAHGRSATSVHGRSATNTGRGHGNKMSTMRGAGHASGFKSSGFGRSHGMHSMGHVSHGMGGMGHGGGGHGHR